MNIYAPSTPEPSNNIQHMRVPSMSASHRFPSTTSSQIQRMNDFHSANKKILLNAPQSNLSHKLSSLPTGLNNWEFRNFPSQLPNYQTNVDSISAYFSKLHRNKMLSGRPPLPPSNKKKHNEQFAISIDDHGRKKGKMVIAEGSQGNFNGKKYMNQHHKLQQRTELVNYNENKNPSSGQAGFITNLINFLNSMSIMNSIINYKLL